jgi:hypothetical protein
MRVKLVERIIEVAKSTLDSGCKMSCYGCVSVRVVCVVSEVSVVRSAE